MFEDGAAILISNFNRTVVRETNDLVLSTVAVDVEVGSGRIDEQSCVSRPKTFCASETALLQEACSLEFLKGEEAARPRKDDVWRRMFQALKERQNVG